MAGNRCMAGMLRNWWGMWRRRCAPDLTEGAELREIATGGEALPSPALVTWLQGHERPNGPLTPAEAELWLGVWREEQAGCRGLLPWRLAGAGAAPDPVG
eukprot:10663558-Alexandrium_andersonii.AAC.1